MEKKSRWARRLVAALALAIIAATGCFIVISLLPEPPPAGPTPEEIAKAYAGVGMQSKSGVEVHCLDFRPEALIAEASAYRPYRLVAGTELGGIDHYDFHGTIPDLQTPLSTRHLGPVRVVRYSRDGTRLATAGDDKTIRVMESSKELAQLEGHTGPVTAVEFSFDGGQLLSASLDGTVRLWELQDATEQQRFDIKPSNGPITSLGLSSDGARMLVADGALRLWNTAQDRVDLELAAAESESGYARFSDDCRQVLALSAGSLAVWDASTGKRLHQLGKGLTAADYTPDGQWAITAGSDLVVTLWDVVHEQELQHFTEHQSDPKVPMMMAAGTARPAQKGPITINAVAIAEDGRKAASFGSSGEMHEWNLPPPPAPAGQVAVFYPSLPVHCVAFAARGRRLLAGGENHLHVWDLDKPGHHFRKVVQGRVRAAGFSPNSERVVYSVERKGGKHVVGVKDLSPENGGRFDPAGGDLCRFAGHTGRVTGAVYAPFGPDVVSAAADGTVRVWDIERKAPLESLAVSLPINSLSLSPDAKRVLLGTNDKAVRLWDLDTKQELKQFKGHSSAVLAVGFSPDGARAVSGGEDRTVRVWNAASGKCIATFRGHKGRVRSVALLPDGRFALSASDDTTVRLWSVESESEIQRFAGHAGVVRGVAVSFDGAWGLSGGDDGTVRVWDLKEADQIIVRSYRHLGPNRP